MQFRFMGGMVMFMGVCMIVIMNIQMYVLVISVHGGTGKSWKLEMPSPYTTVLNSGGNNTI